MSRSLFHHQHLLGMGHIEERTVNARGQMMLYAGNNLDKARRIFERTLRHRPRIRLTVRQRCGR
jgi:hypothetical protein